MRDVVKKGFDISFYYVIVPSELVLNRQFINRIKRSFSKPIPVAAAQKILFVDRFQNSRYRPLDQLIFYRRDS